MRCRFPVPLALPFIDLGQGRRLPLLDDGLTADSHDLRSQLRDRAVGCMCSQGVDLSATTRHQGRDEQRENEYPQSQQESSRRQTSKSRAKRSQSPVCQPHRPDALWSQRVALRGLLPQHLHAALAWRWRRPRDIPQAPVEPTRAAARGAARSAPSHLLSWALIFFSTLRNPPPGLLTSSRARACSALSSVSELCSPPLRLLRFISRREKNKTLVKRLARLVCSGAVLTP